MRWILASMLVWLAAPSGAAEGALVIAGGAIADDNGRVVRAFLDRRPQGARAIAIIPAASAVPAETLARTRDLFLRHGARPADIRFVQLASLDDPASAEDESQWAANADSAHELAKLDGAGAIWFTGGDQARIVATLRKPDGTDTAMLAAIRRAHRAGAVVGGTSAGAAAMSDPMILSGDPVAAAGGAGEPLMLGRGLGFLKEGLTDQHFDARYRLPRLLKALELRPEAGGIGYGVAEDTALVMEGDTLFAVGRGLVTVVDIREGRTSPHGHEGVALRFLADGQRMVRPRAAATPPPRHTRP